MCAGHDAWHCSSCHQAPERMTNEMQAYLVPQVCLDLPAGLRQITPKNAQLAEPTYHLDTAQPFNKIFRQGAVDFLRLFKYSVTSAASRSPSLSMPSPTTRQVGVIDEAGSKCQSWCCNSIRSWMARGSEPKRNGKRQNGLPPSLRRCTVVTLYQLKLTNSARGTGPLWLSPSRFACPDCFLSRYQGSYETSSWRGKIYRCRHERYQNILKLCDWS